ncbi:MAG: response regulator [Alphaproteobacteria bacterium]|nr:response regulator [Alphaproteobacteria bacterium]
MSEKTAGEAAIIDTSAKPAPANPEAGPGAIETSPNIAGPIGDLGAVRVLLVEDNDFVRGSVALILRRIGFREIAEARDGEEALSKLEQASPGVIISDISMAPMDGLEFVEKLRRHPWAGAKRVPVAFLTAHTEARYVRRAAELGVSTYFVKPVERKQFEAQLQILLESARSHDAARAGEPRRPAKFNIVQALDEKDLAAALALRYRVFIDELGFSPDGVDPDRGLGERGDDRAFILTAYDGTAPAGTITVDHCSESEMAQKLIERFHIDEFAEAFGRESLFYIRKAAVAHRYRRSPLFIMLTKRVAEHIYQHDKARFAFVHAAPHLVPLYERLGFRRFAPHFDSPTRCGISVPLCFVVDDQEYLARNRSPILEIAHSAGRVDRPETRRYFEERWHGLDRALLAETLADGSSDADAGLSRAARAAPVLLFDKIAPPQLRQLLAGREVVHYKAQEQLGAGGPSDDVLLLLRGYADVSRDIGGRKITVATYGPGDAVGDDATLLESDQPSIPSAVTEIDAIRIPRRALQDAASDIRIAAQINLNLARIVARRLRLANGVIAALPKM